MPEKKLCIKNRPKKGLERGELYLKIFSITY